LQRFSGEAFLVEMMMPMWLQNLVVLLAVIACLIFVSRQVVSSLAGRKSRLGSCCAKGCSAHPVPGASAKPQAAGERVAFIPVEMLRKR
jgi:hypothetical protein